MKVLVSGGNGFLGQHLLPTLSEDSSITNIDVICRKKHDKFYQDIETLPKVKVHYGNDITNFEKINSYFKDIDIVFHLAAMVSFKRKDQERLYQINVKGTENVVKACKENNVKKLIYVSSTASLGHSQESHKIDEDFKFNWKKKHQKNVYSYSKYLAEKVLRDEKELNYVIVNPSLILGPGDFSNSLNLVSTIKKGQLKFHTPGSNSLVDVRDVARALHFLMNNGRKHSKYIISNSSMSFKELNDLVTVELGLSSIKWVLPKIVHPLLLHLVSFYEKVSENPKVTRENVYYSFRHRKHKNDKIKSLGFKFKYSPEKTISDTVNYLKSEGLI